jgi:hypothetical protein
MTVATATNTTEFPFAQLFTEPAPPTAAERFQAFHKANPHVLATIIEKALRLKRAGRTRWGLKAIFESMRYDYAVAVDSADGFKLNNNYTRPYAELVMKAEPALQGFFLMRTQRGEGGNNGKF